MQEEEKRSLVRRSANTVHLLEYDKMPPQATEMERAVLAWIMVDPKFMPEVLNILKTSDCFYKEQHQLIYSAMIQLYSSDETIELLTVFETLKRNGSLDLVGGVFYLSQLSSEVSNYGQLHEYAYYVKEAWIKRQIITIGIGSAQGAFDDTSDPFDLLEKYINELNNLRNDISSNGEKTFSDHLNDFDNFLKGDEPKIGATTGSWALDEKINGFEKTHLTILAGRPGEGKTTLMLQSARANARKGVPVGVFSMEMPAHELLIKLYAMEAGIPVDALVKGALTTEQRKAYRMAKDFMEKWPIYICDTPAISLAELDAKMAIWNALHKVENFYIDYLQLMGVGNLNRRINNREQEVSFLTRGLKSAAMRLNSSIVALSQLSRGMESRNIQDRRPVLSDLRESGSIEQDANKVIFVFRPEMHGIKTYVDNNSTEGVTEMIVAKSRLGKPTTVYQGFDPVYSKFVDHKPVRSSASVSKINDEDTPF